MGGGGAAGGALEHGNETGHRVFLPDFATALQ
jgi:hypothetical protein